MIHHDVYSPNRRAPGRAGRKLEAAQQFGEKFECLIRDRGSIQCAWSLHDSQTGGVDERLRFVARLLEGEKMALVCREFGISRKTGYNPFAPKLLPMSPE